MKWTAADTMSVLELYLKKPLKSRDSTDAEVVDLAKQQGRSADSVAMKTGNFLFIDPRAEENEIRGLRGISALDKEVWLSISGLELSDRAKHLKRPGFRKSMDESTGSLTVTPSTTSLLAKPFLILTGNSGTGKTRLAENLAVTFRNHDESGIASNVALVPVGADWTDNRAVVGFVNHLREVALHRSSAKRPVYQSNAVVDLLLAADADSERPHFLILDEMNLSHVERYFSDFLSAMESCDGLIRFHDEGPSDQEGFRLPRFDADPVGIPRSVAYPKNLFVIGTVNVDETTYMFSPKVLDRAHVIEFVVDPDDIEAFLENPSPPAQPERAPDAQAKAFLQLALDARNERLAGLPEATRNAVNGHLMNLLQLLQRGRFEFAYRTAGEVQRYLRVCHHLTPDKDRWAQGDRLSRADRKAGKGNWLSDLDDEILQKILPRLHGSRNRVGDLLGALACYAHSGDFTQSLAYFPADGSELPEKSVGDPDFLGLEAEAALFPTSFRKLKTMVRVLVEEQFVSFIC